MVKRGRPALEFDLDINFTARVCNYVETLVGRREPVANSRQRKDCIILEVDSGHGIHVVRVTVGLFADHLDNFSWRFEQDASGSALGR